MQDEERLSGALQENLLTLLCFDDERCGMLRAALSPKMFESSVFREIAGHAIDFIDQYGEAVKDHLPDHLESILYGEDQRKAKTYQRLLDNLYLSRESVNGDYVVTQLNKFVRQQNLKSALINAVAAIDDGRIDEAEVVLQKGLQHQVITFSGGLNLSKPEDILGILDFPEEEGFDLGIPELDAEGIIPRRKELYMLMAPRGRGKSWFLTHCAKQALLQRWSVVIITLEMSEKQYAARLLQSFYSIARRHAEVMVPRLLLSRMGELLDITQEKLVRWTMKDDDIKTKLSSKVKREFRRRPPIRIKQFPTGSLDLPALQAYLDGLERYENFTPDLILIDYPDLMKVDPKNLRVELGTLLANIRGEGVRRNSAVVAVTQGNRESEKATLVTGDQAAEDISKLAVSDNFITLSQTPAEKALGLARLYVEKARNEESKMQILITQALALGQFCLDSIRIDADYWDMLGDKSDRKGRRREDDDQDEPPKRTRRRAD
jgi:replicative DNA helicase